VDVLCVMEAHEGETCFHGAIRYKMAPCMQNDGLQ
jgi:hypothetical protein